MNQPIRERFQLRFVTVLVVAFCWSTQAADRLRILVTNDDGIHAPGIHALASAMREIADVTVIAPDTNRTSMSMASLIETKQGADGKFKTVKTQKLLKVHDAEGRFFGYSLNGSPADCVVLGL